MIEGQRNQNVFILASAFNDFGVNQTLAEFVLNNYATKTFKQIEIKRTIQSAYAQKQNFGTKYYEDEDKVNQIKFRLRQGGTKKQVREEMEDDVDPVIIDNVINRIE